MHTHARKQRNQPCDLLEAQHLGAIEPGQALRRHAVLAAEVAAIGDRHAQIGNASAVAVNQGFVHQKDLPRF